MSDELTQPAPATPSADTSAAPAAAPTPAPATGAQPESTPTSGADTNREGWVPSYRIRETREAAIREAQQAAQQQWAQREAAYAAQLEQQQRQLHAILGVTPQEDPNIAAVRNQFGQLYPGLTALEQRANDLMAIIDRSNDLEAQTDHYWRAYGRQTMDQLFDRAEKSLGAPLSEEGKRALHASFTGYVQSSPENTQRYVNDPKLLDEFWQAFTGNFIEPARRLASATVVDRTNTPIPRDTIGSGPHLSQAPKPASMDERAALAWQQYEATAKK